MKCVTKEILIGASLLPILYGADLALSQVPTTLTKFEIKSVMVQFGDGKTTHTVITKDVETGKIGYTDMGASPVFADVPASQPMYAVSCSGSCKGQTSIHIHGAQNIAGGVWTTHDYLNMHTDEHRLATLE